MLKWLSQLWSTKQITKIDFDAEAREQIFAIQDYIAHELESPRAVLKKVREITQAIRLLETFPDSGNLLTNIY